MKQPKRPKITIQGDANGIDKVLVRVPVGERQVGYDLMRIVLPALAELDRSLRRQGGQPGGIRCVALENER